MRKGKGCRVAYVAQRVDAYKCASGHKQLSCVKIRRLSISPNTRGTSGYTGRGSIEGHLHFMFRTLCLPGVKPLSRPEYCRHTNEESQNGILGSKSNSALIHRSENLRDTRRIFSNHPSYRRVVHLMKELHPKCKLVLNSRLPAHGLCTS